jgi:kynurenine formamidase
MSDQSNLIDPLAALLNDFEIVDLSHTLEEFIPAVPTQTRFSHNLVQSYDFGDMACHYQLVMSEHTGTHMDAPLHFIPEGRAHYGIDLVPLRQVIGRALFIDCSDLPPESPVSIDRIKQWERANVELKPGDAVLFRFGWDRYWKKCPEHHQFMTGWPGLGRESAEYIVQKKIGLVGCDTISIDVHGCEGRPAHLALLGNEILIIENLNNLDRLPPVSLLIAFPLKIKNGSGSPIRPVALIRKQDGRSVSDVF